MSGVACKVDEAIYSTQRSSAGAGAPALSYVMCMHGSFSLPPYPSNSVVTQNSAESEPKKKKTRLRVSPVFCFGKM